MLTPSFERDVSSNTRCALSSAIAGIHRQFRERHSMPGAIKHCG